jgi:pimeloyl-ACP methyl ester carboxylesterase
MALPLVREYSLPRDISIATLEAGAGEPLLFLHGAGGLVWDPFLEALAARYKVYAPYLPGTGRSHGLENIRDLQDLVVTYYDLLDALQVDAVNIVGHSMGGMIACELAAADPSRVSRLIAICPAGVFREDLPAPDLFAMLPQERIANIAYDPQSELAKSLMLLPEQIDQKVEVLIERLTVLQAAAKFLWPIPDKGLRRRMHRIKAPTLILWGRQDRMIPAAYAEDFKIGIPQAEVTLIDKASHLVHLEQTPQCVEAIAKFMSVAPSRAA